MPSDSLTDRHVPFPQILNTLTRQPTAQSPSRSFYQSIIVSACQLSSVSAQEKRANLALSRHLLHIACLSFLSCMTRIGISFLVHLPMLNHNKEK